MFFVKIDTQSRKYRHMSNLGVDFVNTFLEMARGEILDLQSGLSHDEMALLTEIAMR